MARSDSAGVRIVEHSGGDRAAPWSAVELGELHPPDSAIAAAPWGVAADPSADRIYVIDRAGGRVLAFDGSGEYVGRYGGAGAGPGEFLNPVALSVDRHGTLAVWDAGRGMISRWSSEGEVLNERRVPLAYWGPGFHEDSSAVTTVTSSTSGAEVKQLLVRVAAADTAVLQEVPREQRMVELPCGTWPAPRLFAPDLIWTGRSGITYVLNGPEYRIDGYVDGHLTTSIRRRVDPVRVTEALAIRRVQAGQHAAMLRRCGITAAQLVAALGHEDRTSRVQWLATDPDGRLWVTRSRTGVVPDSIDVLGPDGQYLGTLEATGMPLAFVSGSRFVSLGVRPETGVTVLSLYELRGRGATPAAESSPAQSPDIPVAASWWDYAAGIDPAMEAVREARAVRLGSE